MNGISTRMLVANYPPFGGGSERQCALLARHLVRLGVAVTVLTRAQDEPAAPPDSDGVAIERLGSPSRSRWMRAAGFTISTLRRLWRDSPRYQIVHCHGFEPLALAGLAARRFLGKRLIVKVVTSGSYGDLARLSSLPAWRSIARGLAAADAVIVLNDEARREMLSAGVGAERIHAIPNGVEVPPPRAHDAAARNVLFCGRLVPQKNVAGVLRAWSRSRAASQRQLDIVGDGPEREALSALARQLGIEHTVRFHGRVSDVRPFYRSAACLVLFSHAEGLSNAALESLAEGVPVIGSDIPGLREIVRHGETGLLVSPADEAALAAAIDRLLDDSSLALRLGAAARSLVAAEYAIENVSRRVYDLYRHVLEGERA